MTVKTKATTWPYAYKTISMSCANTTFTMPYLVSGIGAYKLPFRHAEMGLEIFTPLYTYQPSQLFMHLNYTFNSGIASIDQLLLGVYVRDTPSSFVQLGGSSVENFMPLNIQADGSRTIDVSLDLTSLLTGQPTNVVFLAFDANCAVQNRGGVLGDTINLWKLDLYYQTIGIRNEK